MAAPSLRTAGITIVLLVLLAALVLFPSAHDQAATLPTLSHTALTPEGHPYDVTANNSQIVIHNNGSGTNNREIYWNDASASTSESLQCGVWTSGSGIAQNGFAFRIAPDSGGYNAVVFVRNIFVNFYWMFSPKMFHTGSDYAPDGPSLNPGPDNGRGLWDSPDGIDLSSYLDMGKDAVYPLHVCVSLDRTNRMCFAVAKTGDTLPPLWDAGKQGGCWDLKMSDYYHDGQGLSGKNGIWAGHIPDGTSLVVDNPTVDGQPLLNN